MNIKNRITAAAQSVRRKLTEIKLRLMIFWAQVKAQNAVASKHLEYPGCEDLMNINSWPPVEGTAAGYDEVGGVTTVRWGTDGLLQSPKPSSGFYVVNSFDQSVKKDYTYLTNGSGVENGIIKILHGYRWDVTVRDDTAMTPPAEGATVNITDGAGLVAQVSGGASVGKVITARVVDSNYKAAIKQPGERHLLLEALMLVDGTSGTLTTVTAV